MGNARNPVDRRAMLAGAGAVGALAAAASLLPGKQEAEAVATAAGAKPAPDTAAGYRLTEHVKQYYDTTRI
jgi:hypothetical protein